jgi:hypothetical protein
MRKVIIESPFRGDVKANQEYGLTCVLDCLNRGEAPLAQHLIYTLVLNDADEAERAKGMHAAFAWYSAADAIVVYTDRGVTGGMEVGIALANGMKKPVEYRRLL